MNKTELTDQSKKRDLQKGKKIKEEEKKKN